MNLETERPKSWMV